MAVPSRFFLRVLVALVVLVVFVTQTKLILATNLLMASTSTSTADSSKVLGCEDHDNELQRTNTKEPQIAIGIMSAFDWQPDDGYTNFRELREVHRSTWMKHDAVKSGQVKVYFVIGNRQHYTQGATSQKQKRKRNSLTSLYAEMEHYHDIVLLNSTDVHDYGKMNAWYNWAADHMPTHYHIKLDDESFVVLDNLLKALNNNNNHTHTTKFLGGTGERFDRVFQNQTLSRIPWLRGMGYILSHDLMAGLGRCRSRLPINTGEEYEDVYTALAIRYCGLDDDSLTYQPTMVVRSLPYILASGCRPRRDVQDAIILHGGGAKSSSNKNHFRHIAATTFTRLHSIYNPPPGDTVLSSYYWIKWERLRQLYLQDLHVCENAPKGDWNCLHRHKNLSCLLQ